MSRDRVATGDDWCPSLPADWGYLPLRRLGVVVGGGTPSGEDTNWQGDIPFVTPPDLRPVVGSQVIATDRHITAEAAHTGSSLVPAGTVLMSIRAPIGYVARTVAPVAFNQGCRALVPGERMDSAYLTYALVAATPEFVAQGRGTTFMEVSGAQFASVRCPVPRLDEQRAIATYLDREIAKVDALIAEQEGLVQVLQERRAAMAVRASTLGLDVDEEVVLDDDPLVGLRPARWVAKSLRHWFISLDSRRIPLSSEERGKRQGKYPYYGASGIIDRVDAPLFSEPLVLVSEDGANLLARSTPIAFAAKGEYWVNNHAHVLRPRGGSVDYWAARIEAVDVAPVVSGSAQPKLTAEALLSLRVAAPDDSGEQREIADYIEEQTMKIDTLIVEAEGIVAVAKERRSALITAAVTGQIDVRGEVA